MSEQEVTDEKDAQLAGNERPLSVGEELEKQELALARKKLKAKALQRVKSNTPQFEETLLDGECDDDDGCLVNCYNEMYLQDDRCLVITHDEFGFLLERTDDSELRDEDGFLTSSKQWLPDGPVDQPLQDEFGRPLRRDKPNLQVNVPFTHL